MLPKVKTKNTFPHLSNLDKPTRTANVLHSWVGLLYVLVITKSHFRFYFPKPIIILRKIILGQNYFSHTLQLRIRASKSSIFRCVEKQNVLIYSSYCCLLLCNQLVSITLENLKQLLNEFEQNIVICQWKKSKYFPKHTRA